MEGVIRIPNIETYGQEIIDGDLILTPIKIYIEEFEFMRLSFKGSTILSCLVKENDRIISDKKKYRSLMIDIWKTMTPKKIFQNSSFNFELRNMYGEKGFKWCNVINMSFQSKDAEGTIKEIINMIHLNKYKIDISIKTEEGMVYHFKID